MTFALTLLLPSDPLLASPPPLNCVPYFMNDPFRGWGRVEGGRGVCVNLVLGNADAAAFSGNTWTCTPKSRQVGYCCFFCYVREGGSSCVWCSKSVRLSRPEAKWKKYINKNGRKWILRFGVEDGWIGGMDYSWMTQIGSMAMLTNGKWKGKFPFLSRVRILSRSELLYK